MNKSQQRRMGIVIFGLVLATIIIAGRLVLFQVLQSALWAGKATDQVRVVAKPERGTIYDRNGAVLAANTADYQIGVSPNLISDPERMATDLSAILQTPRIPLLALLEADEQYVLLEGRVEEDVADVVRSLDYSDEIQLDPLPRRFYPQGELLCHAMGYVDFDGNGGSGLEGFYQSELAGEAASAYVNISPLDSQQSVIAREGSDLVLTIDRSIQRLVEQHLVQALAEHRARDGSIIVMDPRTGALLAMASTPCFDPYVFYEEEREILLNPAVSQQHEPGSVMKLITMAAALDSGLFTPQSTYYDSGVLNVGGHRTVNWDRSAPGTTDMTTLLARSLNVGAATLSTTLGPDLYYEYMQKFGFGRTIGVDLMAEASGTMWLPGDEFWTESQLATNAYGQGIAVTPLQMISAISAIPNNGTIMQPYLVKEIHNEHGVIIHDPQPLSQAISPEVAQQVNAMAIAAVAREVTGAQVEGYTIAGKTGTAQIAENGIYLPNDVIGSFVGWLPADEPELIIFVKLDRPQSQPWGSLTAAPAFAKLASELVVLLDIPPDNIRLQGDVLAARAETQP